MTVRYFNIDNNSIFNIGMMIKLNYFSVYKHAVLCIRRLDAGFLPWRHEFNPVWLHMRFILNAGALEQIFSQYIRLPPLLHTPLLPPLEVSDIRDHATHYHIHSPLVGPISEMTLSCIHSRGNTQVYTSISKCCNVREPSAAAGGRFKTQCRSSRQPISMWSNAREWMQVLHLNTPCSRRASAVLETAAA
jgi:hypothetical protein